MSDSIKAELVYFRIDVSRPEGRKAYAELCEDLKEIPFETWVTQGRFPNGTTNFELHRFIDSLKEKLDIHLSWEDSQVFNREIHLKTDYLFDDQWSTEEGFRLFNKALFEWPALHIKEGYYIRQNPQMIAVLQGTAKCGYCDRQAPVGEKDFCDNCISSPYLEVSDLRLLRMEPIEALQLAHALSGGKLIDDSTEWADTLHAAAAELRRQQARIADLEAQLSAIGAGGGWMPPEW